MSDIEWLREFVRKELSLYLPSSNHPVVSAMRLLPALLDVLACTRTIAGGCRLCIADLSGNHADWCQAGKALTAIAAERARVEGKP